MTDPPFLFKPKRLSLIAQQPTRHRICDDIFTYLTPAMAVEALSTSNGALRNYLAGASASERDFAIRTAIASQRIWEWTDELSGWDWPVDGGSDGFENPNNTSRRLSFQVDAPKTDGSEYIGSLPAREVALYERRIEEISRDVVDLEIEEIKSKVLANHVLPLSRPNTPSSISSKGMSSISTYIKMEDLSVIVTTIIVQTLPNLAALTRLLKTWSIRLGVLQRIPALLYALEDAEVGLKAGWTAISKPLRRSIQMDGKGSVVQKPVLKRSDFEVMKKVLVKKVATPGHMLDGILDNLEGMDDTLPDSWLDRMEAVEHKYSEWVATCERKIRETEWSQSSRSRKFLESTSSQDISEVEESSLSSPLGDLPTSDSGIAITSPAPSKSGGGKAIAIDLPQPTTNTDGSQLPLSDSSILGTEVSLRNEDQGIKTPSDQGSFDSELIADSFTVADNSMLFEAKGMASEHDLSGLNRTMSPVGEEEEEDEGDLPPLRSSIRRSSDASEDFVMMHEDTSRFDILSSDLPEVSASPPVPNNRIREAEFVDDSPPSSPPLPLDVRESQATDLFDSPVIASILDHDESMFDKALVEGSFTEDFDDSMSVSEAAGSAFQRDSSSDKQLRRQISEIIESIPAKIKLSAEPSAVNLNPPDLQLPRLKRKPSKEPFKRSTSSLSSRTATPSFTLSPARTRPRHTRGQPEVRIYHLSRNTGEPPIKLLIRCVGEHGERVMVRVGGGWADLSEYLKEYASHHGRRSAGTDKAVRVEVQDVPRSSSNLSGVASGSSPPRRPPSAAATAPEKFVVTPLNVRKTRRSIGAANGDMPRLRPKTPAAAANQSTDMPSSEDSKHSRPGSRLSWVEDDSSFLGLAGPTGKKVEMSEENKAWVESVKEKVRLVSGERKVSQPEEKKRFGELGKVGGTKRLFRKAAENGPQTKR
ncbi:hypothetical protein QQS21_007376 [Conoideocrella luteorostrata]|uniref:GAR domain-containing protein n=1 Tax=Conoideocrella luteorostrata TaxID=1105319 RepID=A0AAJ0FXG0_9HYPO|nr:hypothetical protein QQS21_007376 [Conoideocrella luteorostrata]